METWMGKGELNLITRTISSGWSCVLKDEAVEETHFKNVIVSASEALKVGDQRRVCES